AIRIVARLNQPARSDIYSSRLLPPRCTRRRFAELCRSGRVVGARREGRDWVCFREAWDDERARPPVGVTRTPSNLTDAEAKADALLTRCGLRVVRGAR